MSLKHSRSQQRTDQRVLVLTLIFLALKKLGFPRKKILPKMFLTFFTFILCSFSVRMLQYFQKKNLVFAHESIKKWASKVAHKWP